MSETVFLSSEDMELVFNLAEGLVKTGVSTADKGAALEFQGTGHHNIKPGITKDSPAKPR